MTSFYTSVERVGNFVYYIGYENNRRVKEKIKFSPTLFIPTKNNTKFKTLHGQPVQAIKPGGMREARDYIERHSTDHTKVYGNQDYVAQYLYERFPNGCKFDLDVINSTKLDIEVQSDAGFPEPAEALYPVTAITLKNNLDNVFYAFSTVEYNVSKTIIKSSSVVYTKCEDEADLLKKFIAHWSNRFPDIVTGWNSDFFDMPYLINRIMRLLGENAVKMLSPWMRLPKAVARFEGVKYEIPGISQLDYLALFKKFGFTYGNQESFKLDNIANVVLGEKKLDYSEYGSLNELYRLNPQKFIDYNIRDVDLVDRIDDQTGFISLALTICHMANVNYESATGSVKPWDSFIYNVLMRQNIVVEPKNPPMNDRQIEGAYVKQPLVGMHDWVMSFDLNSLYPHLIIHYNMSPETIVDGIIPGLNVNDLLKNGQPQKLPPNTTVTATGQLFRTDVKGIFPQIVEDMYDLRTEMKKKAIVSKQELETTDKANKDLVLSIKRDITRFDNQQNAVKIFMNSLYGAMSNIYFRYYDTRIAEAITISGQLTIRWSEKYMNNYLNRILSTTSDYVIAIDTDSIYVNFGPLIKKMTEDGVVKDPCRTLDQIAEAHLVPMLADAYEELRVMMNAPVQKMSMKREIIADRVIFTGKKRYVANVLNSEGVQYAEPKIKITGIEAVKSSTPQIVRAMIKEALGIIMTKDESSVQSFIDDCRTKFKKARPEDISFPRGVSDIEKWAMGRTYKKGTPIHVRASILYNELLKIGEIDNKYEPIKSGNKIKFLYLKMPNPIRENVIGFPSVLPPEFKLERHVDYDKQFEKTFIEPIRSVMNAVGWNTERISTLEDFFA